MKENVLRFPGTETEMNISVDEVLKAALNADLKYLVVLGELGNGDMYFASSTDSGPEIIWYLESAKRLLLTPMEDV